jgi:hypothetical protein
MVRGPSPERAGTTRLRRNRLFPGTPMEPQGPPRKASPPYCASALKTHHHDHVGGADRAGGRSALTDSSGSGGDDAMEGVGHPVPNVVAPAGGSRQLGQFGGGALTASDREHHMDVKELRKMQLFRTGHEEIDDEQAAGPEYRPAQIGEDADAFIVAPIVQDRFQTAAPRGTCRRRGTGSAGITRVWAPTTGRFRRRPRADPTRLPEAAGRR